MIRLAICDELIFVREDSAGRAVGGLSLGGVFAVNILQRQPELFDWYLMMSGGIFNDQIEEQMHLDLEKVQDKHLYLCAGSKETGLLSIQRLSKRLTEDGVVGYHSYVIDGGHDWDVWRQCFTDYVVNELWK